MYHCAKACDECCTSICKACENCANAIGKCFSRPFSFCAFVTFFLAAIPGFYGIYLFTTIKGSCDPNIGIHLLIQSINNMLTFFFVLYLVFKYGKPYDANNPNATRWGQKPGQPMKEEGICTRTCNLILYDFCVCTYMFLFVFFCIWANLSTWFIAQHQNGTHIDPVSQQERTGGTQCWLDNKNAFYLDYAISQGFLLFMVISFFTFLIAVMIYSCDEGSCRSDDMCRTCAWCCTCMGCFGMCDCRNKKNRNRAAYNMYRQSIPQSRRNCLSSSLNCCRGCCLGGGAGRGRPQAQQQMAQQQYMPQQVMPQQMVQQQPMQQQYQQQGQPINMNYQNQNQMNQRNQRRRKRYCCFIC